MSRMRQAPAGAQPVKKPADQTEVYKLARIVWETARESDIRIYEGESHALARAILAAGYTPPSPNSPLELLKDIAAHIATGAPLYEGSLIFKEDAPAVDVIKAELKKWGVS